MAHPWNQFAFCCTSLMHPGPFSIGPLVSLMTYFIWVLYRVSLELFTLIGSELNHPWHRNTIHSSPFFSSANLYWLLVSLAFMNLVVSFFIWCCWSLSSAVLAPNRGQVARRGLLKRVDFFRPQNWRKFLSSSPITKVVTRSYKQLPEGICETL